MRKKTIFFIIVDLLAIACFVLFYGPYEKFRETIVSTAMVTKTHQYIAYTFYNDETIQKIVSKNGYTTISQKINLDEVVINTGEKDTYDNEYEEAIFTRDKGNEDYKYLKIKVGKYDAHLVAIYDPSKVVLMTSKAFNSGSGLESVTSMCKRYNAKVGINAGGFQQDASGWGTDVPLGYVIKDGKTIWHGSSGVESIIGMTYDNKLMLVNATADEAISQGIRDGLQFGPFLIVNGETIKFNSVAGGSERAARVVIAQRKDGVILFLVTEGTHALGPNLKEVVDTLKLYGAYNAANLDGGTSSQMIINGNMVNVAKNIFGQTVTGGRRVVTAFGLVTD